MLNWQEIACKNKNLNVYSKFDIPAPWPQYSSRRQSTSSEYCSYKGLGIRTFLRVPPLLNLFRILQDLQGTNCLWGSIFNLILWPIVRYVDDISVFHGREKGICCFHPSLHCILSSSPSLFYLPLDGLIDASGLRWGCMFPMNISTPHCLYSLKAQPVSQLTVTLLDFDHLSQCRV